MACRRAIIGALTAVGFGALVSGAWAAAITVAKPCYVNQSRTKRASMTVVGSGFAPGGQVTIASSDGSLNVVTTASTTGAIAAATKAPDPSFTLPGQRTVMLTAVESTVGGTPITATTPVTVAPLAVAIQPSVVVPTEKVTWYFSGFTPGELIFGHYLRGKQVALARFGRAHDACGVLAARAPLYPGGHPRHRLYGLQLDDSRRYNKRSTPRLEKKVEFQLVSAPPAQPPI
jgi:hypothetical protein